MIIQKQIHTNCIKESPVNYTLILPSEIQKTCLWLHGYGERANVILEKSEMEALAETYKIAVLIPDVPDTYYLDQTWNKCYTETFLIKEFLQIILFEYSLPSTRENLCISGISMGGFGSLLLGSHYPKMFGKIACISGAFIIDDILIGNPEVTGKSAANVEHFQNLFGDLSSLDECYNRNPFIAAKQALLAGILPPVFMTCGTEDMLHSRNQKMMEQLSGFGAAITWKDAEGGHSWKFCNSVLGDVFAWLAYLDDKNRHCNDNSHKNLS